MFLEVVADTNGLRESLCLQLLHLLPFRLMLFFTVAEERSMDEVATTISQDSTCPESSH